jgi:SagB-type dehydrogenase family enzyme
MGEPVLQLASEVAICAKGLKRDDVTVRVTDPLLVAALTGGVPVEQVAQILAGSQARILRALHRNGMLIWQLPDLASAEVLARGIEPQVPRSRPGPVALSRFAILHRQDSRWILDSGLSQWRLTLSSSALPLFDDGDHDGWLTGLLEMAGMLDDRDAGALDWSLHDRLFLSRTRERLPFLGQTARQRGIVAEPGLRAPEAGLLLPVPDGPRPSEPTLWEATQARRTVRDFANRPVRLPELGHLLWRTLRVTQVRPADPADPWGYDTVLRPVPSGGAMHATDLWLFCRDVEGVEPGAYRYDPSAHSLVPVDGSTGDAQLWAAPVAGLITCRHKRTAWKYEPFALSLELKDVGVQMMALQLTAPAVGLGVCPIGTGSTAEVARVLGIDPFVDAPIGEFLLGALPARP